MTYTEPLTASTVFVLQSPLVWIQIPGSMSYVVVVAGTNMATRPYSQPAWLLLYSGISGRYSDKINNELWITVNFPRGPTQVVILVDLSFELD